MRGWIRDKTEFTLLLLCVVFEIAACKRARLAHPFKGNLRFRSSKDLKKQAESFTRFNLINRGNTFEEQKGNQISLSEAKTNP